MKTSINYAVLTIAAALLLFSSCVSADAKTIKGNKNMVTKEIAIEDYQQIKLTNSLDIVYEQKELEAPYLKVEVEENLFEYLVIKTENSILSIGTQEGINFRGKDITIRTNSKSLEKILITGSGDVDLVNQLRSDSLGITVTGSGQVNMEGNVEGNFLKVQVTGSGGVEQKNSVINFQSVDATVSGSGEIKLAGKSVNAEYLVSGSGEIQCKDLIADKVTCKVSGSGEISVFATQELNTTVTGSGEITYRGDANVTNHVSGSGKVRKE